MVCFIDFFFSGGPPWTRRTLHNHQRQPARYASSVNLPRSQAWVGHLQWVRFDDEELHSNLHRRQTWVQINILCPIHDINWQLYSCYSWMVGQNCSVVLRNEQLPRRTSEETTWTDRQPFRKPRVQELVRGNIRRTGPWSKGDPANWPLLDRKAEIYEFTPPQLRHSLYFKASSSVRFCIASQRTLAQNRRRKW